MADDPGVLESLYLLGRAIGNLCNRRRKRPHCEALNDRVQGPARVVRRRTRERRAQLEDFRRHLADHFGADSRQRDNERIVKEENDRIGARLIADGFLPLLHDEEVLASIRRKQEAEEAVDVSKSRIKELRGEELQILIDVVDDLDDNTVTPMFNEKVRDFLAALQAQETAKHELEHSRDQVEILQARLQRTESLARRGFGRWIFDPQPVQEALDHSRSLVQFLESTASCCSHVVEQRLDALWQLRDSKDWANQSKAPAALLAAEQWDEAIRLLKIHRKNIENGRRGYSIKLREELAAGRSRSDIDREHLEYIRSQTLGVRGEARELKRARALALAHGAELLEAPELAGDDPVSEPATTLPSDGRVSSMAEDFIARTIQGTDTARIGQWLTQTGRAGTLIDDYRSVEASEPSVRLMSDGETSSFDSQASWQLDQKDDDSGAIIDKRIGPEDSHSNREKRQSMQRKIMATQYNRLVLGGIRAEELPDTEPLLEMRHPAGGALPVIIR